MACKGPINNKKEGGNTMDTGMWVIGGVILLVLVGLVAFRGNNCGHGHGYADVVARGPVDNNLLTALLNGNSRAEQIQTSAGVKETVIEQGALTRDNQREVAQTQIDLIQNARYSDLQAKYQEQNLKLALCEQTEKIAAQTSGIVHQAFAQNNMYWDCKYNALAHGVAEANCNAKHAANGTDYTNTWMVKMQPYTPAPLTPQPAPTPNVFNYC